MTLFFEYKVLDGDDPVFEHYTNIKTCNYYFAQGRTYLKLYKNKNDLQYDFCIDLSNIKSFIIEN